MSARDRLIAATVAQVRRHGVAGTSVSGILDDSGLARRTLYLNFPNGKPELVAAATETASRATISGVRHHAFGTGSRSGWWRRSSTRGLTTSTRPTSPRAVRSSRPHSGAKRLLMPPTPAGAAFAQWVRVVTRIGEDSGLGREAAEEMATMIVATVEGAVVMSIAERSSAPLRQAGRGLVSFVRATLAEHTERPSS